MAWQVQMPHNSELPLSASIPAYNHFVLSASILFHVKHPDSGKTGEPRMAQYRVAAGNHSIQATSVHSHSARQPAVDGGPMDRESDRDAQGQSLRALDMGHDIACHARIDVDPPPSSSPFPPQRHRHNRSARRLTTPGYPEPNPGPHREACPAGDSPIPVLTLRPVRLACHCRASDP